MVVVVSVTAVRADGDESRSDLSSQNWVVGEVAIYPKYPRPECARESQWEHLKRTLRSPVSFSFSGSISGKQALLTCCLLNRDY